ncbi:RNA-directed DNA polymerase, eukaryota [Tanacetum coccineum]
MYKGRKQTDLKLNLRVTKGKRVQRRKTLLGHVGLWSREAHHKQMLTFLGIQLFQGDFLPRVDFAKAYDSVRWDYLDDVLFSFGFGVKWRSWIKGSLISGMASVLVNGSPTSEFQFHCGLKQGDHLAPYLFILVMESLHLSVSRTVEAGIFTGIKIDSALSISHLFYADDAVFIGEWTDSNLRSIIQMLHCFSLASGLKINLQKSNLLGVGVTGSLVNEAAASIGCSVMKAPFKYLGVMVGGNMSKINAWDDMVGKIKSRLSKWKINTLSIVGHLTLLKAVLGSTPIYPMSLYKVLKTVLHEMESLRRNFFNGVQGVDRKISWVKWTKVLASKKYGGLGVSSFYALNRALLFRWVWRFLSHDNSLWFRFISAMHGSSFQIRSSFHCSNWLSIIREVSALKLQGIDFLSHCKRRVGSGMQTRFWEDLWLGEVPFNELFPRLYALENNKECSVAVKMQGEIDSFFRRHVRGGVETQQLENIQDLVRSKVLSNVDDRWAWDLNRGGDFCVKDARDLVDEVLLPKENVATRWIKTIPIKVNVFAWKLHLDRLPTRSNLLKRGIQVQSSLCPICNVLQEDTSHLFFSCDVALAISRLICRWWNVSWSPVDSYSGCFCSPINFLGSNSVWIHILNATKKIEAIDLNFKNSFVRKVADGASTSFWHDPWCGDGTSLKDKFPRLYALELNKDCNVKDRGLVVNEAWIGSWDWRIPPRGRALDDLNALHSSLSSVLFLPNGYDKWIWSYDAVGLFKKVNVTVWKASLDRLATRPNLVARGVALPSSICPFCDSVSEDIWNVNGQGNSNIKKAVNGVFQITFWVIWNWRNRLIHASGDAIDTIKNEDIFPAIQRLAKLWMSARIRSKQKMDWNCWVARPYDLFS